MLEQMISFINTMPTYFEKDFVDLNQPSSARIEADLARIELRQRESSRVGTNPREKKKKNTDAASTREQPCRTRVRHPRSRDCAF